MNNSAKVIEIKPNTIPDRKVKCSQFVWKEKREKISKPNY